MITRKALFLRQIFYSTIAVVSAKAICFEEQEGGIFLSSSSTKDIANFERSYSLKRLEMVWLEQKTQSDLIRAVGRFVSNPCAHIKFCTPAQMY